MFIVMLIWNKLYKILQQNNVVKVLAKLHIVKSYEEVSSQIERKLENFRIELNLLQKNKPILLKSIGLNVLKLTILYILNTT